MKKFWECKSSTESSGELYIYGEIVSYKWDDTDTTAKSFKADLDGLGDITELNIYINSPGGSVFQGIAIYNIIKRHKAKVNIHIDGLAASIASVIAMAGDTVHMPENAMMMIHNPWTVAMGNASDLRKIADDLDKTRETLIQSYLSKSGDKLDLGKLEPLLDAETWLTAQECYDYGLCNMVGESKEIVASIDGEFMKKYQNTPERLLKASKYQQKTNENEKELRKKMIQEATANIENINFYLEGLR
ncbi:Clp protease ClpP [Hazenella sp. IB182357]|uniref:ATP-dependent Clp protease proteolytic subunit n=1 Tax=Polycladospora coralii TaxID=2771432 RepID=A0A926N824_9BACL|nr:head maturation protease, ClpP-related [Polycladospora coralii]MBD1373721.1 Clp protease ClpP [Polycladospora coralii]